MFGKKKKGKKGEAPEAEAEAARPEAAAEGEGAEGEAPAKKKLPLKLVIVGAAALLLLGGGGAGAAWFFVFKDKGGAEEVAAADGHAPKAKSKSKGGGHGAAAEDGEGAVRPTPDGGFYYTMPEFQTNLQSTDGRPNHMSMKVTLELADEADAHTIDENMPRVQDLLQSFLRELRPDDLNGSQGTYRLRQEIQRRMNLVLAPAEVKAVLIEELLQS